MNGQVYERGLGMMDACIKRNLADKRDDMVMNARTVC